MYHRFRAGWRSAGAALLFLGATGAATLRALDFRLDSMIVQEDGLSIRRSYFRADPKTRINIDLPAGWTTTSDENSIITYPPVANVQVKVEKSPFTPAVPFKDAGLDTYRRAALAAVPNATGLKIEEEEDAPLPAAAWKDYEFVLSYDVVGQTYRKSKIFINLNAREQIVLTTVAPRESFEKFRHAALDMMWSWRAAPAE